VVPPSELRPDIPPRLDTLILSMLAADREDRPQSAEAVLDELCDIERTADLELLIAVVRAPRLNSSRRCDGTRGCNSAAQTYLREA